MKIWKPSDRQCDFLALPDTIFEALYGGAAAGGKSEVLLNLPLVRGFYNIPGFKGLLMRRTFPELEKSLILRSHDYYAATGGTYISQLRRWKWPSGAIVDFGYAEYEQDIRRYDTSEYNYIGIDELTSFTEFQYLYITSRCRSARTDLPRIMRGATNPGNIGHGWCRKRFVEPAKDGYKIILDPDTNQKRIFIPAKIADNPYIMQADPGYMDRLKILPEAERRAKADGDWWTYEGQVFDDFRYEKFPDEPENAIHVIEPFEIPSWWPVICAGDWGYQAMTWFGWAAISPEPRAYLFQEYSCRKKLVSTWGVDVANLNRRYESQVVEDIGLDPSAWQQRGQEKTIAEQFEDVSGLRVQRADNDRLGGKTLLQEYLRWRNKPVSKVPRSDFKADLADRILRVNGLAAYQDYLASFQPEKPESNLPKLQIFKNCHEIIRCLPLCVYDEVDKEDVAEFDGDDPYDGCRYLIKLVDKWLNESKDKVTKIEMLSKISKRFEETKNYTAYHIAMSKLERDHKEGAGIYRRKHSAVRII